MKNVKAWIAVLLVAAVASYIVFAMAMTQEELKAYKQDATPVDWNTVSTDPGKVLKVRMLMAVSGEPDSWMERFFEERFNLEIEPVFLGPAAYQYAKPLMMAGGDIPDLLLEPDPIMVQRDAYHGFLLTIPPEVILKHAPSYANAVNAGDPIGWLYGNWNGVNYGIPRIFAALRWSVPGVWRQDWLRKVGIEKTPETLEEMHEAFRRFTFDDPDGNGKQDT